VRLAVAGRRHRRIYYGAPGAALERREFDSEYVKLLTNGDPAVEQHFSAYFGALLNLKLRRRFRSREDIEDIRQDTLLRVLQTLRKKGGIDHPERLGAFVNAVCNNVMLEKFRDNVRHPDADPDLPEPADRAIDLHGDLVAEERKRHVRMVLEELPEQDRRLLRLVFFEEAHRDEVCRSMNVDREYLRVLLYRARMRFKALASQSAALAPE